LERTLSQRILKESAITPGPSRRAASIDRWQALERVQFLALVAAPAKQTSKEGSK
jgi:hypothetical protein